MTISMNCAGLNQNVNFKGSHKRTENGNPYWNTTAGATAGCILAVPAFLINYSSAKSLDGIAKFLKKHVPEAELKGDAEAAVAFESMEKMGSASKKMALPMAIVAAACSLGCGIIVDHIRNNKAKEVADLTARVGAKNALRNGDGVSLSRHGKTYYDSNTGSKYGALLGAGCGVISHIMSVIHNRSVGIKVPLSGVQQVTNAVFSIAMFALGGWIMGKITDNNTNKAAERKS